MEPQGVSDDSQVLSVKLIQRERAGGKEKKSEQERKRALCCSVETQWKASELAT